MDHDPDGPRSFATTHWSLVLAARDGDTPGAREALEGLCGAYWYPLYAFVRRQGHDPDEALDLVQGFFARLLEKGDLRAVDPAKGRFRSFLIAACAHFLSNRRDHARALRRGGGRPPLSLDAASYRELASRAGLSEGAARVAAHRLRTRYRALLRDEVGRTVADPADVDQEIRDLFDALSAREP